MEAVMRDVKTGATLAKRLERIEARIRRIHARVQEGSTCPDLLQDLAGAEDALRQVSQAIIGFHVGRCVQSPSTDEPGALVQMAELVDIFDRFV